MMAGGLAASPRIMLVEDERIVAFHLRQQLQKLGYHVPAAVASGEKALRQIEEHKPDLILMDIHIEGEIDGIETAARIPEDYHIPVVYLTAYSEESTVARARATRPYGYLLKPFSERELHATIQMALERRAAEIALKLTEDRLRQAQKMEVVGQLAGGVAHDFNNLLAIIQGNLELVRERTGDAEIREMLDDALKAAGRGATLTQQLLAYSRRQPLAPKRLVLDRLIADLSGLLRRMLGETIQVRAEVARDLRAVRVDPNQLESALLNLAVNARDAMPEGGRITIEAANAVLDEGYAADHAEVVPGSYVMIAVTDTGRGMSKDVAARALEPFFTTKPVGQGTGLGLSMVFGFVKQSQGHLKIYSEPGHGTTVKLYLAAEAGGGADETPPEAASPAAGAGKGEVVLVVEDDPSVRKLALRMLAGLGYRALEAEDAGAAMRLLEGEARIDLLLTDVVLPGAMGGTALARAARERRPGLGVLYMSGYTANAIVHNGVLDEGVHLLTKPFGRQELAAKLREVLAAAPVAKRLLVVDDEPDFAAFVERVAASLGYVVETVTRAAKFQESCTRFQPTVIVLDVVMPETDGVELVRWLATQGSKARVIIASGYSPHYAKAAEALGLAGGLSSIVTLRKPVSLTDLQAALR
jgi:CheY-like chemotaxis protein/two-component sensor histidine kinase